MCKSNIDVFFNPRSIAVIGASQDSSKIGHIIARHLLDAESRVYMVNPRAEEILGRPCYPDLASIPDSIDLAVVALPATGTVRAVEECVRKGVRGIIAVGSGFGETGEEGERLERQIREILRGVREGERPRLLGPNTVGVYVPRNRLDTLFIPRERVPRMESGWWALASQSGAVGVRLMVAGREMGLGLSAFIGLGNKLDVGENEIMDYLAEDVHTRVIAFYLESFADGRGFLERCRQITLKKPVVVLKSGRSQAGLRAAALHTGSLAGSDRVADGALRQGGVCRAYDEEELLDLVLALGSLAPLSGPRVGIITAAGGHGVILSDLIESRSRGVGLRLAEVSEEAKKKLRSSLLPYASVENPIDVTGNATNEHYEAALNVLLDEEGVDAVICILVYDTPALNERLNDFIIERFRRTGKAIVVATIGDEATRRSLRPLAEAGIPVYPSLWRAARAVAALYERGRYLRLRGVLHIAEETLADKWGRGVNIGLEGMPGSRGA